MDELDEFMKTLENLCVLSGWSKFMDDKKTQLTDDETTGDNTDDVKNRALSPLGDIYDS